MNRFAHGQSTKAKGQNQTTHSASSSLVLRPSSYGRSAQRPKSPPADEALIVDVRCQVRPAQQVEDKLLSLLKSVFVPLSQVRMSSLNDGRGRLGHC